MNLEGTPKNLDEVVARILCTRPPEGLKPDQWVRGLIRDFLAQHFGVAYLECEDQVELFAKLWNRITNEDEFPPV